MQFNRIDTCLASTNQNGNEIWIDHAYLQATYSEVLDGVPPYLCSQEKLEKLRKGRHGLRSILPFEWGEYSSDLTVYNGVKVLPRYYCILVIDANKSETGQWYSHEVVVFFNNLDEFQPQYLLSKVVELFKIDVVGAEHLGP